MSKSVADTPDNVLEYSNCWIKEWTTILLINKDKTIELSIVFVIQPVVGKSKTFRDHPRKLPWGKTFKLTEQNGKLHA
jgi:hypothetical protein